MVPATRFVAIAMLAVMAKSIGDLSFAQVYPLYVAKVERKGRTQEELDEVLRWLTGLDAQTLNRCAQDEAVTFRDLFDIAPMAPNAGMITGVICGIRVENIEDPLTQKARYMDKVVDELAKGKSIDKITRS